LQRLANPFILNDAPSLLNHVNYPDVMAGAEEHANEQTRLLSHNKRLGSVSMRRGSDAESIISSHLSRDELAFGGTAVGERLAYNDYTTIDWIHDLVSSKSSQVVRWELLTRRPGQRLLSSSINP